MNATSNNPAAPATMTPAVAFFYNNAAYSHNPKTETPAEGRLRCAIANAEAEAWASANGYRFTWERDTDFESSEDHNPEDGPAWICTIHNPQGAAVDCIGGIVLDGQPPLATYSRVMEAELAVAVMAQEVNPESLLPAPAAQQTAAR